ncbi:MAG: lamin tail domain-containing protein, partial [Phycisphaerae bacterium]|nr:lamin tail domain-containing protein [Phycisphaerae bacterium]
YTLDGSDPWGTTGRSATGRTYTDPIHITTTTCLRACAAKTGCLTSVTDTHTYIFLDDVCRQATDPVTGAQVVPPGYPAVWPGGSNSGSKAGDYQVDPDVVDQNGKDKFGGLYARTIKDDLKAVPTVSVVMDRDDWFGPTGIYINEGQDGTERVCSLEWIDPNGGGCQANCAIAMQGGSKHDGGGTSLQRWKTFKLSMRPRFKAMTDDGIPTGGPSEFNRRIFPDSPVTSLNTFVLDEVLTNAWNHAGQHQYGTYIQDQYVCDIHNAMGGYSPHGRYAHVYINGLYWGMYYVHERPDDAWAAEMFGGQKEEYDVIKHSTARVVNDGINGSGAVASFNAMISAANKVSSDPANMAKYDDLCRMLDVDDFIKDLLTRWYATNWDWPEKNWYATHRSPDGPWRFHTWDAEHSMEWFNSQTVLGMSEYSIHDKLKGNAEYRMRFADIAHEQFFNGGTLTVATATSLYRARMAEIDRAIVGESARWGDTRQAAPHTREEWLTNQDKILTQFIPSRSASLFSYLEGAGLYPNVEAPVFHINGVHQHGGYVASQDQLSMQAGGTIWYTLDGSDPRVPGTTASASGLTLIPEDAAKRVLVPAAAIGDTWRSDVAFDDSGWISGTGGVGYERSAGYEGYIGIDLRTQMYGVNASSYIRVPFMVLAKDLPSITSLTLRMRHDDGFVAYLNGVEVARTMFNGTPAWNSTATGNYSDSQAVNFEPFDLTGYINLLRLGTNLLAIQGLNQSATSSDYLISFELTGEKSDEGPPAGVTPTALKYTGPITLAESALVRSRTLSGNTWSAMNEAVFAVGPAAENLRISEIMYHPANAGHLYDADTEYIELTNIGTESINLNMAKFANGVDFTFPSYTLAPGAYCLVIKDSAAFVAKYGSTKPVAGQYAGSLDNGGEKIELLDAMGTVIQSFSYRDNWYDITDGGGFSLTVKDPAATNPNALGDKACWRPSAHVDGSPGTDDSGDVPELGSVVINELLANSQDSGPDWIELHNTTSRTINIGGWFLSDDADNLTKYEIAAGTSIAPSGYIVFTEDEQFGNSTDPGCHNPFALSAGGETVYLHSGSGGVLTGYSEQEKFDASEAGVSLGRYEKSTGSSNFVALSRPTPGEANAGPLVGPIVINEIMYHPDDPADAEYVELLNVSDAPVTLYDVDKGMSWRFSDNPDDPAIELLFPTDSPVTLAPGEYLLMVKDASLFASKYTAPAGVKIFAWGAGKLANDTDKIQISKP